jgi:hypothetical protein
MAYNKLSNYRTAWTEDDEGGVVIYAQTKIVEWKKDGKIKLNSDGWQTVTTKRKMNQTSQMFNLGFGVYQRDFEWFVDTPDGRTLEYYDGMEF